MVVLLCFCLFGVHITQSDNYLKWLNHLTQLQCVFIHMIWVWHHLYIVVFLTTDHTPYQRDKYYANKGRSFIDCGAPVGVCGTSGNHKSKMMDQLWHRNGDAVKIILLCGVWYVFSSGNNIVGKIVLTDFPYPMTVSMVQLLSISIYLIPVLKLTNVPAATPVPIKYWFQMIIPLAMGKFFASLSSHISLWKVPVSYAHTGR